LESLESLPFGQLAYAGELRVGKVVGSTDGCSDVRTTDRPTDRQTDTFKCLGQDLWLTTHLLLDWHMLVHT